MSTPSTTPATPQILAGLKVLELGQLIAGPVRRQDAGDFGADVIKIEPPGVGDPLRKWRLLHGRHVGVVAGAVAQQALDRARPAPAGGPGASRASWSREADVLIENFQPGHAREAGASAGTQLSRAQSAAS